jgi:hypothetical protein
VMHSIAYAQEIVEIIVMIHHALHAATAYIHGGQKKYLRYDLRRREGALCVNKGN